MYKWLDYWIIRLSGKIFSLMNRKYRYKRNFKKVKFHDKNKKYPEVIKIIRNKKNKKRFVVICRSYINYSVWLKCKETLETAFNSKLAIKQDGKQRVKLIILGRN